MNWLSIGMLNSNSHSLTPVKFFAWHERHQKCNKKWATLQWSLHNIQWVNNRNWAWRVAYFFISQSISSLYIVCLSLYDNLLTGSENNSLYVYYKGISKQLLTFKFDVVTSIMVRQLYSPTCLQRPLLGMNDILLHLYDHAIQIATLKISIPPIHAFLFSPWLLTVGYMP